MERDESYGSVIKGMGVYLPPFCVDVNDLAKSEPFNASDEEISELKDIIGPHKTTAVADMSYMDSVVLALNAFENMKKTSGDLLLPTHYHGVKKVLGGTEDPPDKSKPTMALMMQNHFRLPRNLEVLHSSDACGVGGNMLLNARDFTLLNPGLEAIVAMADIARYDPEANNAYKKLATAGAGGAVFLLGYADLRKDKWLIKMPNPGTEGFYAQSFPDFWVPNGAFYPEVNGLLSCWCYNLGVLGAVSDHFRKLDVKQGKKPVEERLKDYKMVVMHTPFVNQVRDAFCLIYSSEINGGINGFYSTITTLEEAIAKEAQNPESRKHRKPVLEMIEKAIQTPGAMKEFNRLTGSWHDLPPRIGNLYSASLPASLMYGLQNMKEAKEPFDALLVFFGSGLQAIAMSVTIHPDAIKYAKQLDVKAMIDKENTIPITPGEYLDNIVKENPKPFESSHKGYFMKKSPVERGYPEYSRIS